MLDDQGMTEEWIVRVHGKEYGPADVETLREWKAEGRLLPGNEARRADTELWKTAAEIPGLFNAGALAAASVRRADRASVSGPRQFRLFPQRGRSDLSERVPAISCSYIQSWRHLRSARS